MNTHIFNEAVTCYTYKLNKDNGMEIMVRTVLPACHWEENSVSIANRTGVQLANNVSLVVMREMEGEYPVQLRQAQWEALPPVDISYLEQFYTFLLAGTGVAQNTLIYRGIIDHRFIWAHPTNTAITPANERLAAQYNTFRTTNPSARALKDVNFNWYSRRRLHHVEVRT